MRYNWRPDRFGCITEHATAGDSTRSIGRGTMNGSAPCREHDAVVAAAVERGITFFDTAENYGPFTVERVRCLPKTAAWSSAGPDHGRDPGWLICWPATAKISGSDAAAELGCCGAVNWRAEKGRRSMKMPAIATAVLCGCINATSARDVAVFYPGAKRCGNCSAWKR
jgi:hypothetical protein